MNEIQRLYLARKSRATKPFNARGKGVERCELCLVSQQHCICSLRIVGESNIAFLLLYHDKEILKPSSTGKLIADVIPETYGVIWQRTIKDEAVIHLLNSDMYFPMIVFPHSFAKPEQVKLTSLDCENKFGGKRPLLVMIDASWREARRIFNKSDYLHKLPMISLSDEQISSLKNSNAYNMRKAEKGDHFCTAEVASQLLYALGEERNSEILRRWLNLFNFQYQKSVCQENKGDQYALEHYLHIVGK